MSKKDINKDFKKTLNHNWLKEKIKSSEVELKNKISVLKCKISTEKEIYINHDFSPEIVEIEEILDRPITCDEYDMLVSEFIKLAIKIINKK